MLSSFSIFGDPTTKSLHAYDSRSGRENPFLPALLKIRNTILIRLCIFVNIKKENINYLCTYNFIHKKLKSHLTHYIMNSETTVH